MLRKSLAADLGLALITVMWGTTFIMMKKATGTISPLAFLSWRYALAAVVTAPFLFRVRRGFWFKGLLLGAVLWCGMALQIIGIQTVSAGAAGFITGLAVVIVPIIEAVASHRVPAWSTVVSAGLAGCGLFLLSGTPGIGLSAGALYEFIGAVAFALQIFLTGRWAHEDPAALAGVEMAAGFLLGLVFAVPSPRVLPNLPTLGAIAYMALFGSVGAVLLQSYLQRFTSPYRTALIFTLEPVFAAVFAYLLGGEVMRGPTLLGAGLVLAGLLLTQRFHTAPPAGTTAVGPG